MGVIGGLGLRHNITTRLGLVIGCSQSTGVGGMGNVCPWAVWEKRLAYWVMGFTISGWCLCFRARDTPYKFLGYFWT